MATITPHKKACAVNPLKMSAPIGAALAYLGVDRAMPVLHGSQGCTAFGLVVYVRHFKETIPLQTTAMNEVSTILGGLENIEQAIGNIYQRAKPALLGLASTGLTETKGDDVEGYLKLMRDKHPEWEGMEVVYASTPDYVGSLETGWAAAVAAMVESLAEPASERLPTQVNILANCHLTPGDIEEIRDIVESFNLQPIILPDLSGSLDGHIPETFVPHTLGGTKVEEIRAMGRSCHTLVVGESMRGAAEMLKAKTGVDYTLFDRLTGLEASDHFIQRLMDLTGHPATKKVKKQRSQLQDAMLDGHFYFGGVKVAIGAEPDLLYALGSFLTEMGAEIEAAVTTVESPILEKLIAKELLVGDLEDLEQRAAHCGLLVTHSHGRQAAERLGIPFYRAGIPMFDRLGAAHKVTVGYRGTRELVFELANLLLANSHEPHPDDWRLPEDDHETTQTVARH
jgi:nitrogenase molybdenum-iron protein NifN